MPQAYSADLRHRIVSFVEAGHSRREAARMFDVSPSFVIILMRRFRSTGNLEARPRGGSRHDSLLRHLSMLVRWIESEPGLTLAEMSKRLEDDHGVSSTTSGLSKLLRRSGYTYKKIHAGERSGTWQASAKAA
jgi:Transposase and inactivated derivatives